MGSIAGANLRFYYSFEYGKPFFGLKSANCFMTDWWSDAYWHAYAGPIHFLQYDSETPFVPGSLQYEWILNDLASVDRTQTPWVSGLPCCIAVHAVKVRFQGCSAP